MASKFSGSRKPLPSNSQEPKNRPVGASGTRQASKIPDSDLERMDQCLAKLMPIFARHESGAEPCNFGVTELHPQPEQISCIGVVHSLIAQCSLLEQRVAGIEKTLVEIRATAREARHEDRAVYTTASFAEKLTRNGIKRHITARTVQRWCREKRIRCKKRPGRGKSGEWVIDHAEYLRYAKEGLSSLTKDQL